MTDAHYDLLLIDSDRQTLKSLEGLASDNDLTFVSLSSGKEALEHIERTRFKVVVIEMLLPGISGLQILEWIKSHPHSPEVLVITSQASVEAAVKALKLGAFDYITKPFDSMDRVGHCMRQALEKYQLADRLHSFEQNISSEEAFENIVGKSPKMQAIFDMIRNIAASDSNVLISGESGTGKELVAHAIHRYGNKADKPFVVINCAAMPETLLESELFGYQRGAFTGANQDKEGLFEVANGGTVFLDEIGEVPLSTQVKLLRVLQEGELRRIGDTQSRHVHVRIMAATNKDLIEHIRQGKFRDDLYYRLNVISIHMPPLRERKEDIVLLAHHFLKKLSKKVNKRVHKVSVDALQAIQNYTWPGNVRELENVIERAIVLCEDNAITAKNLPPKILSDSFYNVPDIEDDLAELSYQEAKKRALNIFNRSYILALLEKTAGNITAASEKAGMDRSNFKKILRKYRIDNRTRHAIS